MSRLPSSFNRLVAALAIVLLAAPLHAQPAAEPRFDILEFVIAGDTLLGAAALERIVDPFLGPGRTVADAEAARKALEQAYQDAGFLSVTVQLPPQRVDMGGEVRLQVVQATVERLRVTGAQYHLPSLVKQAVPSLAPGSVPNFNELQQELADLARTSDDRDVTPILAAGETPGTMSAELKVQDRLPLHGYAELNTKQSPNTQRGRLEAGVRYDNLFQRGHSVGLDWIYSPRRPNEANVQTATYVFPLGGIGDRASLALVHSDSDTPTPVGGATVSRGLTTVARWRDELPAFDTLSHGLTWGLTWRDLRDRSRDEQGVTAEPVPLRYATLNVAYDLAWNITPEGRSTNLQAALNIGPRGFNRRMVDCGGTAREQFDCKRPGASPGFQTLGLGLTQREPFGRWALTARLQMQLADSPLVTSEQVSYGGESSARGYDEGEQRGDEGAALRLELASPGRASADGWSLAGFGFFDAAIVHRLEPAVGETATVSMRSTGFGLRAQTSFGLAATLSWARLLADTQRNGRTQRWDLSVRQSF